MKHQHIARLEEHLEQFIEGAFANLFGKKIQAQDIALRLARAMEDALLPAHGRDPRPIAPDRYTIHTHPDVQVYLLEKYPQLAESLAEHMVDLATKSGYRLNEQPGIQIIADENLATGDLMVDADHSERSLRSTMAMKRVEVAPAKKPHNAQLIIDGQDAIRLKHDVINIGRGKSNHIVLEDPYISRHHLQLRLRSGNYILFDVRSHSGTFVNGIQIKEHHLRSGDVIQVGRTQMIYMEDESPSDTDVDQTHAFDPYL